LGEDDLAAAWVKPSPAAAIAMEMILALLQAAIWK
jgi:hypothetical protein